MKKLIDALNAELLLEGAAFKVEKREIHKNNITKTGFVLRDGGTNSPVFYPDADFIHESLLDQVCILKQVYERASGKEFGEVFGKSYILENVLPRLVSNKNCTRNDEDTVLYLPFLDMLIEFYVLVDSNPFASYTLHNEHLESLGVDVDVIFRAAVSNLRTIARIKSLYEIVRDFVESPVCPIQMLVVTNVYTTFGASVMLLSDLLMELGDRLGEPFLILPSSIHEVICVETSYIADLNDYVKLVSEVNKTELLEEDILTDSVYICEGGYLQVYKKG
jgi:hypothetical protein